MMWAPSGWLVTGTLLLGLLAAIVPLPAAVGPARPYLLALLLAYWAMEAPDRIGLGIAFVVGVAADLTCATPLGEQALRLVVLVFLVQRFRARLRFFPLWQQSLAIGLMLANDQVIVALLRLAAGATLAPWTQWLSPMMGLLLWPWLFVLLDMARLRARERG